MSNKGRVRSVDRVFIRSNGKRQPVYGKILKPKRDKDGYLKVYLSNQGIESNVFVHRLVASAFIPNPDNRPEINHINSIRDDNRVDNLEWVTSKENSEHSYKSGFGRIGLTHKNSKQIALIKDGKSIAYYESLTKCSEVLKMHRNHLYRHIKNKILLYDELIIVYTDKENIDDKLLNKNPFKRTMNRNGSKPVLIKDLDTSDFGIYESMVAAERANDLHLDALQYSLKRQSIYKKRYLIEYATRYEYLTIDEQYVNKKIIL